MWNTSFGCPEWFDFFAVVTSFCTRFYGQLCGRRGANYTQIRLFAIFFSTKFRFFGTEIENDNRKKSGDQTHDCIKCIQSPLVSISSNLVAHHSWTKKTVKFARTHFLHWKNEPNEQKIGNKFLIEIEFV